MRSGMSRNDKAERKNTLPFIPNFRRPPMPKNYRLADACGPIHQMPVNQENPHYHKTGVITSITDDNKIKIDHMYPFVPSFVGIHKVNDFVLYECFDGANGALVIAHIVRNYGRYRGRLQAGTDAEIGLGEDWDSPSHVAAGDQVEVVNSNHGASSSLSVGGCRKSNVREGFRFCLNREWEDASGVPVPTPFIFGSEDSF